MWTSQTAIFCKEFDVSIPIIQAPMAGGPTTPALVAATSNSGGLGSIGAGYLTPNALSEAIREVRRLTPSPFSVNVFARSSVTTNRQLGETAKRTLQSIANKLGVENLRFDPPVPDNLDEQIGVICDEHVPILSFTFGLLEDVLTERLLSHGIKLVGTATCVAEAQLLMDAGSSAIVAQGYEAGGHRGSFLNPEQPPYVGGIALIPQIVDKVDIPVIASGGIMDGRGIAASLMLGAGAVQMGTAFLATVESGADECWKSALVSSDETSTTLTRAFSGKFARGIVNEFVQCMSALQDETAPYPLQNQITSPIRSQAKKANNPQYMSLWAGQGTRLIRRIATCDLVKALVEETNRQLTQVKSG